MSIDLERSGINPQDPQYQTLLSDLQGNVLQGHGRDFSCHVFLRFDASATSSARTWIATFARTYVTTALAQYQQARIYHLRKEAEQLPDGQRSESEEQTSGRGLFASFLLSSYGYEELGFAENQMPQDPSGLFYQAMKNRGSALADPPVNTWESAFQGQIDALILLASDDRGELEAAAAQVTQEVANFATVLLSQEGTRWRNDAGNDIEPFGFADGLSQPLFYSYQVERARQRGTAFWDPSAPLSLALFRDPNGIHGEDSYGSFAVYRKLEQDVAGFTARLDQLASTLGISRDLAGAYAMGRFQDGTPVVTQATPDNVHNDFNFAGDTEGRKCPLHSHIRKTNPRGETTTETLEEERGRRLVRRGVPYGERGGSGPVGLLFLSYQADFAGQFEFQQSLWANTLGFLRANTGLDPVIGQGTPLSQGQAWPRSWGGAETVRSSMSGFVMLKGGEYFYAPSIGFLRGLDQSS